MKNNIISTILIIGTSLFLFGCNDKTIESRDKSNNIANNQTKKIESDENLNKELEKDKDVNKQIEHKTSDKEENKEILEKQKNDIFSGIWFRSDEDQNSYLKIREGEIQYQSNINLYLEKDIVKEIKEDYATNYIDIVVDSQDNPEGELLRCNLIDKETLDLNGRIFKKLTNVNDAVIDLQDVFYVDKETADTSNGLNEFLDISEDEVFACFNMYKMKEISQDEVKKVRSLMKQEEAEKIAINFMENEMNIDGEYFVHSSEIKFGNKIGYTVIATINEDGSGVIDEIFVEASTKEIGIFIKGYGYAQMVNE